MATVGVKGLSATHCCWRV